jgi:hypothetical protein
MKDLKDGKIRLVTKDGHQLLYNADGTQLKGLEKTVVKQDADYAKKGICLVIAVFPVVVIADENFKTID